MAVTLSEWNEPPEDQGSLQFNPRRKAPQLAAIGIASEVVLRIGRICHHGFTSARRCHCHWHYSCVSRTWLVAKSIAWRSLRGGSAHPIYAYTTTMIEAYIFDQDGTLYPRDSSLAKITTQKTKQWLMNSLDISEPAVDSLYTNIRTRFPNPFDGFSMLGLAVKDYHQNVFETIDPAQFLQFDSELFALFATIKVPKYV